LKIVQVKSYGVSNGLVHVKTLAIFITHVQYLLKPCSATYILVNTSNNNSLNFPQTSTKRSLHLMHNCDHAC